MNIFRRVARAGLAPQRSVEGRYRSLFEHAREGMMIVDAGSGRVRPPHPLLYGQALLGHVLREVSLENPLANSLTCGVATAGGRWRGRIFLLSQTG